MTEWEPLLWLLMFLTGWFVCWIQMSKSESRKVETLQSLNRSLLEKFQSQPSKSEYLTHLQLENQQLKFEYRQLQSGYQNLLFEYQKIQSKYRQLQLKSPQKQQFESPKDWR